jgi:hypothetical protein
VRVGAIEFSESEDGDGGMGRSNEVQYYHVFRNQICYEFQLGEGVGGYGSATGIKSHVDDDGVFRRLKTILATVAIRSTTIALPRAKSKERQ